MTRPHGTTQFSLAGCASDSRSDEAECPGRRIGTEGTRFSWAPGRIWGGRRSAPFAECGPASVLHRLQRSQDCADWCAMTAENEWMEARKRALLCYEIANSAVQRVSFSVGDSTGLHVCHLELQVEASFSASRKAYSAQRASAGQAADDPGWRFFHRPTS